MRSNNNVSYSTTLGRLAFGFLLNIYASNFGYSDVAADKIRNDIIVNTMLLNNDYLEDVAFKDHLTGIPNRQGLEERSKKEYDPSQGSYLIFVFDATGFKQINDEYGHDVGDEALK